MTLVDNAYFALIDTSADGDTYAAQHATEGPWAVGLQHGGPPNALLVHTAEQLAAGQTGRADLRALRLAADFQRPVPVGDVTVTARVVRAARTVVLVDAAISAQGRECLTGRVWLVRTADTATIEPERVDLPGPPDGLAGVGADFPYGTSIEWRSVHGGLYEPGPALVWARPRIPVVEGFPLSTLQRAALIGDSASGVSAELDWRAWSFLNIDLDVHVAREMRGDWLLMDAITTLSATGAGLARSSLSDTGGALGTTAQTLVVEKRSTADA